MKVKVKIFVKIRKINKYLRFASFYLLVLLTASQIFRMITSRRQINFSEHHSSCHLRDDIIIDLFFVSSQNKKCSIIINSQSVEQHIDSSIGASLSGIRISVV